MISEDLKEFLKKFNECSYLWGIHPSKFVMGICGAILLKGLVSDEVCLKKFMGHLDFNTDQRVALQELVTYINNTMGEDGSFKECLIRFYMILADVITQKHPGKTLEDFLITYARDNLAEVRPAHNILQGMQGIVGFSIQGDECT